MRWTEGYIAASERPWRRGPRRGRSAWSCGWVSREPGRPRRLHRKDRRGAGTGSPRPRPWTSHLASDGANRRCSDGTAGRRQRSAGGWTARSRSVSEYRRSGGIEPTRPRGGKGAPAGGTGGWKDGQHTEVGSRLHVTTTDSRTGQTSRRDGGGHRLASWTSGYATARSEAVCRGAGCGRTRTSGSVGGQGQQRPWSTRPVEDITGAPSESFETIARRYIAQPDLIVPGLRAGTKLEAYAFMIKMMLTRAPDLGRYERERGHPILSAPCSPTTARSGEGRRKRDASSSRIDHHSCQENLLKYCGSV